MIVLYLFAGEQLGERLEVEFEGREFYPDGFALVPENLFVRYFFGWFFNFFVPYPFVPFSVSDVGYFFHWVLFFYVVYKLLLRNYVKKIEIKNESYGLMLCALFMFSFVLTTTPGAGPLVRYRLFAEIIFIIGLLGLNKMKIK